MGPICYTRVGGILLRTDQLETLSCKEEQKKECKKEHAQRDVDEHVLWFLFASLETSSYTYIVLTSQNNRIPKIKAYIEVPCYEHE